MLNLILKDAFARAGLTLPARYVGSHVLRHSLATNLVRHGASLEEISDVLRHRSSIFHDDLCQARHRWAPFDRPTVAGGGR